MRGIFFTLDMALALFWLATVFSGQIAMSQSGSAMDISTKLVGQDVLNAMDKTDFLRDVAQGSKNANDVQTYLSEVLPVNMAANFSLIAYEYNSDFQVSRAINASTGNVNMPYSVTRRVTFVLDKSEDLYVITELRVGFK